MGMPQTNASPHQFMAQLMPFWGSHWQISYVLETPHTVTSASSLQTHFSISCSLISVESVFIDICSGLCLAADLPAVWLATNGHGKVVRPKNKAMPPNMKLILVLKFIYCPICSYFYMWYNVKDCFTGGPFYKPFSFVLLLQELWLSQPNTVSDTICNVR